tara:strand:+ start:52154 stop:53680 length:1527 start_codon:yes stop_codon:yes gene_type:complete
MLFAACDSGTQGGAQPDNPGSDPAAAVAPDPDTEGETEDAETPESLATSFPDAFPETFQVLQPWKGDLDGMEERRVVRVLTVYGIGRYYLDGVEEKGMVSEMADRFEDFLNKRLQRNNVRVHVVVVPVARNQLIPALLEGRGDIVDAGLTITEERAAEVEFSIPISKPLSEILVTGPSAPELESIEDLSGQTLYLRESSSYRESVEALNARLQAKGKAPVKVSPVSELLEDADLVEMVNAGLLPWAVIDEYKSQLWDEVFTDLVFRDEIVFREGGRLAWAFRKNSPQLAAATNEFLKKNRAGTLLGNMMINRYIKDFDWAANALAEEDYSRFEELRDIFQKYGEQYGLDYLMVAAQGYQESRLNQSARSHAGAVGVMQLLPSTAADKNVGIPDITGVDSNIHAGVKYLDFLRERYFNDPDIDKLNKTLLALAAYNAGPRKLINMRKQAKEMGYDPNVWFDNVELVAAKVIGRETVQYVANIYKYYVAYLLSADRVLSREAARERAGMD